MIPDLPESRAIFVSIKMPVQNMKKHILTFIILLTGLIAIAGNNTNDKEKSSTQLVSGKVIDKVSGEEIAGAEIKLGDKIIYTDLNGNFSTSININNPELTVSSISYNDIKITINSFSYDTIIIELASN